MRRRVGARLRRSARAMPNHPSSKRLLVSGGAGFLGSHLCERLLADGHQVICVDDFSTGSRANVAHLDRLEIVHHDVNEPLALEVDAIFHLACPASPVHYSRHPVRTITTSVVGTLRMLDLARATRAPILIASTSEVYGDPREHPQREDYWGNVNPIGARACYDEGKRCGEAMATCYAAELGVEVRIARIFNTYGPRMHERDGRVVSNFVTQALRHEPITLYGDGSQTRSFCYVSDLIEGLVRLMALERDPGPVNLGNPEEMSIRALAELVVAETRSRSPIVTGPLPEDDPARRRPDIRKAMELLGWQPRVPIREGLAHTIRHFRALARPARVRPQARNGRGLSSP